MVEKKKEIVRAEKAGLAGGVDKRNQTGRATWNRESEGMLPLLVFAREADRTR